MAEAVGASELDRSLAGLGVDPLQLSIAAESDGHDGTYVLYRHDKHSADLWHRVPGRPTYCLIGKQVM